MGAWGTLYERGPDHRRGGPSEPTWSTTTGTWYVAEGASLDRVGSTVSPERQTSAEQAFEWCTCVTACVKCQVMTGRASVIVSPA